DHVELEHQLGFYVNTLAIKTQLDGDQSFRSLLHRVKEELVSGYAHQEYPFDMLVEDLGLSRDMSRSALFDVMVVLQDTEVSGANLGGLEGLSLKPYPLSGGASKFDLTISFHPEGDALWMEVEYNEALFTGNRIERMLQHYEALLTSAMLHPETSLNRVRYMPEEELNMLLHDFNATASDYPREKTIQALFEDQVQRTPDSVAVVFEGRELTYWELNEKSNRLAHYLRTHYNMQGDDLVGLMVQRSEWMIVGILGILKSGAAYVPIDPEYPEERKIFISNNSGIKALLTDDVDAAIETVDVIHIHDPEITKQPIHNPEAIAQANNLIYVIYTSGTTGNPKGVQIEHRSVVNLTHWLGNMLYRQQEKPLTALLTAPIYFDASVQQLFAPLANGSKLVMVPDNVRKDPFLYVSCLQEQGVSLIDITPAFLKTVMQTLQQTSIDVALDYVLVGGESLPNDIVDNFSVVFGNNTKLFNVYGITEVAVDSTVEEVSQGRTSALSIGRGISNTKLYILDDQLNPVPCGISGELFIGGDGVGRGYVSLPELTGRKFIENPFAENERLFRTGDVARWLPDGSVEFLGRNDHQVKIRGYRIELHEVANTLRKLEYIHDVIVLKKDDTLAAYFVSKENVDVSHLAEFLTSHLPYYMIPSSFTQIESMPLTRHGKVDLQALPDPVIAEAPDENYGAPENDIERKLVAIWQMFLQGRRVNRYENFFLIGGNSLIATQIIAHISSALHVTVSFKNFFLNPTIKRLAGVIAAAAPERFEHIPQVAVQPHYEVSHAQNRLWLVDQHESERTAYIVPVSKIFDGKFDSAAFIKAFNVLIERHEILRTTFALNNGVLKQIVHAPEASGFVFHYEDIRALPDKAQRLAACSKKHLEKPFDLGEGPLVRATLLQLADERHAFLLAMHHIICDGWSMNVIINEVMSTYAALMSKEDRVLPPLHIQYKDFAAWQNQRLASGAADRAKAYWKKKLTGATAPLELPLDFPRPRIKTNAGATISTSFTQSETMSINALAQAHGVSLFVILLSATKTLLYRYTGQHDIVVGTPTAGRDHVDLHHQVGFYVNTLPLRDVIDGDDTFASLVLGVKQTVLDAFENQLYPFDKMVEDLNVRNDPSRSALFDVMVMLQNNATPNEQVHALRVSTHNVDYSVSKFDLLLNFYEADGCLNLDLEYNVDLFTGERINRMIDSLKNLLSGISREPETTLNELSLVEEKENAFEML
ncbi:non-ribosomal peptide synthetase, partial [Chryseolinea lacunae]